MRFALTGSSGFIGKAIKNHFDDVSAVPREKLQYAGELNVFFKALVPDIIIHCAAYGNMSSQKEPQEIIQANIVKTENLLLSLTDIPVKLVILMGSSSEYGIKADAMRESDPCKPVSLYGITKLAMTNIGQHYYNMYGLPVCIVRPFSIYGPGEADNRFIPTVCRSINSGKKVKVCKGNHDWTYISDFVHSLDMVIQKIDRVPGKIINVGTGIETDNIDIVKRLFRIAGKEENYEVVPPMRSNDSLRWFADNRVAKSIGWLPRVGLDQGLSECYKYYATN